MILTNEEYKPIVINTATTPPQILEFEEDPVEIIEVQKQYNKKKKKSKRKRQKQSRRKNR